MLGTWFAGGHELCVGEWQKIALARAFVRNSQIVVLDEPTSAMDPLAEAEVFAGFRQAIEGRMAILVSHRFSTVKLADRIYVVDHGHIVESGSHAELMALRGKYATMFRPRPERIGTHSLRRDIFPFGGSRTEATARRISCSQNG